jgi:hypothetical protein
MKCCESIERPTRTKKEVAAISMFCFERDRVGNTDGDRLPPIPPQDESITTLFVGGGDETITDQDFLDKFSDFGMWQDFVFMCFD